MAEVELVNEEELNYGQEMAEVGQEKEVIARLNVREEPSLDSAIVCVLEPGEKVKVLETDGDWTHHEKGWSMTQYLG